MISAGVPSTDITVISNPQQGKATSASNEAKVVLEELRDFFIPDEDRYAYAGRSAPGGYLVTVRGNEGLRDEALDILDREGAVDMDQRESAWRSEGWSGYAGAATGSVGTAARTSGSATSVASQGVSASRSTLELTASQAASGSTRQTAEGEEAIPVMEEQLRIGKREVNHGRIRVRSYVVETPVQQDDHAA